MLPAFTLPVRDLTRAVCDRRASDWSCTRASKSKSRARPAVIFSKADGPVLAADAAAAGAGSGSGSGSPTPACRKKRCLSAWAASGRFSPAAAGVSRSRGRRSSPKSSQPASPSSSSTAVSLARSFRPYFSRQTARSYPLRSKPCTNLRRPASVRKAGTASWRRMTPRLYMSKSCGAWRRQRTLDVASATGVGCLAMSGESTGSTNCSGAQYKGSSRLSSGT